MCFGGGFGVRRFGGGFGVYIEIVVDVFACSYGLSLELAVTLNYFQVVLFWVPII